MFQLFASQCEIDESKTELIVRVVSLYILQNPSLTSEKQCWPHKNERIEFPPTTRIAA